VVGYGAEPRKVRLSFSSRSNSVTPFQVALVKGFFKEEMLEVEMIQANPRLGALAVMNGDLDFTTTLGSTLRGILQGLPLKFVAVSVKKSEHFLVVRPEIKELQELKGKRLGVSTLLGTDQRAAEEMLRSKGFNPAFLQILALGDSPVRAQALRSGLVEAVSISPPHDLILKHGGFNVLAGPQDIKFALPTSGLAVTSRLLQER
jgi:ABC-type nitrate/sulfonate/bicarbonate transport system substrate-binding protein